MSAWLSIMGGGQTAKVKDGNPEGQPAHCSLCHFTSPAASLSILWPYELVWWEARMKKVGGEDGEWRETDGYNILITLHSAVVGEERGPGHSAGPASRLADPANIPKPQFFIFPCMHKEMKNHPIICIVWLRLYTNISLSTAPKIASLSKTDWSFGEGNIPREHIQSIFYVLQFTEQQVWVPSPDRLDKAKHPIETPLIIHNTL